MHQNCDFQGHDKTDTLYTTINFTMTLISIRKHFYRIIAPNVTKQTNFMKTDVYKGLAQIYVQSCDVRQNNLALFLNHIDKP
jgi:hypothetical protein